jgi:hypothetical protein
LTDTEQGESVHFKVNSYRIAVYAGPVTDNLLFLFKLPEDSVLPVSGEKLAVTPNGIRNATSDELLIPFDREYIAGNSLKFVIHECVSSSDPPIHEVVVDIVEEGDTPEDNKLLYREVNYIDGGAVPVEYPEIQYQLDTTLFDDVKQIDTDDHTYGKNFILVGVDAKNEVLAEIRFLSDGAGGGYSMNGKNGYVSIQSRVYDQPEGLGFRYGVDRYILIQYMETLTIDIQWGVQSTLSNHMLQFSPGPFVTTDVLVRTIDYFLLDDNRALYTADGSFASTYTVPGSLVYTTTISSEDEEVQTILAMCIDPLENSVAISTLDRLSKTRVHQSYRDLDNVYVGTDVPIPMRAIRINSSNPDLNPQTILLMPGQSCSI